MRNSATHDGKDLAKDLTKQIALLRTQLDDLAETVNVTGSTLVGRGEEVLDDALRSARELIAKYGETAKARAKDAARINDKATDALIEQTEVRPFTTLAAIVGIGFLAGWLFR